MEDLVDRDSRPYDRGREQHYREPFTADVSAGKYHPFYRIHPYPTKVPHKAVMRYMPHYTEPNDIVFHGLCGTGRTGVAAQLCGSSEAITELGYRVLDEGGIVDRDGSLFSRVGLDVPF